MTTPADTGSGASGTATSANSVATSSTLSPTSNNCLAGFVVTPTAITVSSVSDGTNQYILGTAANNASGARITPFYANNVSGSGLTVTAALSGTAANALIGVREYSGVGSIAGNRTLIDASAQATGNTNAPTVSATPQQSGSLYVVGVGDLAGSITYTAGGSVTRRLSLTSPIGLAIGEQVGSSTSVAALASAWSASGTVQWSEAVIVLRPAGTQATSRLADINLNTGSPLVTGSYTPRLGSVLLAIVKTGTSGKTTTSVADSATSPANTWTLVAGSRVVDGSGGEESVWLCNGVVNAASQTFTATVSAATLGHITILELSGVIPNTSIIDQVLTATGNGTAVSVGPTSATAIPGELALLCVATPTAFGTSTNGGSTALHSNTSSADSSVLIESLVLTATGTQTMTATLGTSSQWSAVLITLKIAGANAVPLSLVQSTAVTSASGSGPTGIVLPFNATPGNNIIAVALVSGTSTAQTMSAVSDGTNTWAVAGTPTVNSNATNSEELGFWRTKNIAGGKTTISGTRTGASKMVLMLYEIAGGATDTWYDVGAGTTGNGQTVSLTNPTPNYLFRLVVAAGGDNGTGRAYTSTSPFAQPQAAQTATMNLAVGLASVFESGIVPTGTSTTLSIPGGSNVQYVGGVADFKIARSPTYQQLSATSAGTSAASATAAITRRMTASSAGTSTISAAIKRTIMLTASSSATSALSVTAKVTRGLHATAAGTSTLTGVMFLSDFRVPSVLVQFGPAVTTSASLSTTVLVTAQLRQD